MDRVNALVRRLPTGIVWAGGLLPLGWLVWAVVGNRLGPDPVKAMEQDLGLWALQFLIISLCISPLRRLGLNLVRFRRALGVTAFLYATLHVMTWIVLDMGLRWPQILGDLYKRPYILLGMIGIVSMLPLALTSTDAAIRRMGALRWRRLHRLAYLAAAAGAAHFVILVKGWPSEPMLYAGGVVLLLLWRVAPSGRGLNQPGQARR